MKGTNGFRCRHGKNENDRRRDDNAMASIACSDNAVACCRGWYVDGRVCNRYDRGGRVRRHSVYRGDRRLDRQRTDEHHQPSAEHQRLSDRGAVTVEAAFAIAALVVVLALCVAGVTAVS